MIWLLGCVPPAEVRYDGDVVVRVPVDEPADVAALAALGDLWSEQVVDTVDVRLDRRDLAQIGDYTVLIDDVQAAIDATRPAIVPPPGFYDDWQDLDAIEDHLDDLDARSPDAEIVVFGTSNEGREVRGIRIGRSGDSDRLGILVTGAQHAREWVGAASAVWIAERLIDLDGVDPEVTTLLDRYEVVVVPVVNVDGYAFTWTTDRLWRKNRRDNGDGSWGVDLNRNWDLAWGAAGAAASGWFDDYRGAGPFSEPETAAISSYVVDHPTIGLYLDLHCTGQVAVHPFAFTPFVAPDQVWLAAGASAASTAMQAVSGTLYDDGQFNTRMYVASGVAIDWSYGSRGLGAWLFELRDRGQYGFLLPRDQLVPTAEEAWAGLVALSSLPDRPRLALSLNGVFVPGAGVAAEILRAEAGASIEVYTSTTGVGSTVLADGTQLGLDQASWLGTGTAGPRGRLTVRFVVPPGAAGKTVWVQARAGGQRSIVASADVP